MANIADIDKNFKVETSIEREGLKFYDCKEAPFRVYGLMRENGRFCRMPEEVAKTVNDGVRYFYSATAGGRVRFKTDSEYVAISANLYKIGKMPHFPLTGSVGFDMYADGEYTKTFVPPFDVTKSFDGVYDFGNKKQREILIEFPLYSGVEELYIGLNEKAVTVEGESYVNEKPVVYYGSSITQGGCASRPGTCYQAIVSRRFNCDYVNLGFSGSAKAEPEMVDYIKNLDMSMFVYDYDHNAPDLEHLINTHEKMFLAIRETHPDIPIIMMPRPRINLSDVEIKRAEIVRATYENAVKAGDKNVYHIDSQTLCQLCGNEGTVDNCHPNDFGFASMAKAVGDVIEKYNLI